MHHDSTNGTDTTPAAPPAATKLPRGVWSSGRSYGASLRVRGRGVYLGRFPTAEAAIERQRAATELRDARQARGEPVTRAELRGLPADGGPDLFAPETPEARTARLDRLKEKRARAWFAAHPNVVHEPAKLTNPTATTSPVAEAA